jgi:4,5-dihydroxyphthalate decarboxylase
MMRYREFDCAEMSLSSYVASLGEPNPPFVAIPAFPSRCFRHSCIFVSAKSGITRPEQLIGVRCGVPEYQLTSPVWTRGILADEYKVPVESMEYLSGGQEEPGRIEKRKLDLPPGIRLGGIPADRTLSQMLADGEIDALQAPRTPSTLLTRPGTVRRLFENYVEVEREYYRRTRIFPIMHTVVVRRDIYERHPWVAQSLYKAFLESKRQAYEGLAQTAASMAMLPWLFAHVEEARRELGEDWWSYGMEANRHVLETFLRYHHQQGLSKKRLKPEDLFAPETLEEFKV